MTVRLDGGLGIVGFEEGVEELYWVAEKDVGYEDLWYFRSSKNFSAYNFSKINCLQKINWFEGLNLSPDMGF